MRCLVRVGLLNSGDPDLWAACGSRVGWCKPGSGTCPAPGPCTKGPISHALSWPHTARVSVAVWGSAYGHRDWAPMRPVTVRPAGLEE